LFVTNLRTSFENGKPSLANGRQKWWEEPRLLKLSEWRRRGEKWGLLLPAVYHGWVKRTADSDICLYCQIEAYGIQCPNKQIVKLLITASTGDDAVFRIIAISTAGS